MNDDSLFDWEEEWTPKIPVQVFIDGEDPTGAGLTEAGSFLNTFFSELHASTLDQMQFHAELEAGGTITISHIFGVTQVDIALNPPKKEEGVFYGGILLKPTYITNESTFFGSYVTFSEPTTVLVDEVKNAGTEDGEGGRPAVPGTLTSDETDWLVVQIAKNKPLGDSPITSGTVKIFRIKDPKFGPYVETNDAENTYLLSAAAFASPLTPGLEKFFLCGKEVLGIPPLSFPSSEAFDSSFQFIRIRSFGLQFDSFEEAANAHGIIIVAAKLQLYVLDTNVGTWQLLDSIASFDNFNDYGATFAESSEGNTTTITCTGSNGAGVCSGFEVVIEENDGELPTFTGRIFPMADGSVLAGAPTYAYHRTVFCNSTTTSAPLSIAMLKFYDPDPDVTTVFWDGDNNLKVGATEVHAQGAFSEGTPAKTPDKFLGGFLPTYPPISYDFTHDWTNTYSRVSSGSTFYIGPSGGADEDLFLPKFWSIGKIIWTEGGTLNYRGCALGDMSRSATLTDTIYGREYGGISNGSIPTAPADVRTASGSTYTYAAQPTTLDPTAKFRYVSADLHTDQLRLRREETRNGATTSYTIEDKYAGQHVRDGSPPTTHFGPFRLKAAGPDDGSTGQVFVTVTPPQLRIELLRRNGEVVYSWPNVLAESPSAFWQTNPDAVINIVSSLTRRGGVTNTSFSSTPSNYRSADPIGAHAPQGDMPPAVSDLDHTGGTGFVPRPTEFLDYAAWYSSGGSTVVVYDPSTGDPHNQFGNPLDPPSTDPSFAEAATPWSIDLTYPGNYPTVPLNYSDYAALLPMTKHALTPFTFDGPGSYYNPAKFELPDPPFTPIITRGFLDGVIDSNMILQGVTLYDIRSNGFIAQMRAAKRSGFSTFWNTHEVIIGNDYDSLPLATVLDEWKALGENSGLSDGKHIFTQFAFGAALL